MTRVWIRPGQRESVGAERLIGHRNSTGATKLSSRSAADRCARRPEVIASLSRPALGYEYSRGQEAASRGLFWFAYFKLLGGFSKAPGSHLLRAQPGIFSDRARSSPCFKVTVDPPLPMIFFEQAQNGIRPFKREHDTDTMSCL
jgi:hypothetical protein